MQKMKKYSVFFVTGGLGYGVIEILWRGHTHWTMILAGGICFAIFSYISEKFKERPLFFKSAVSAVCVTAVEFSFGILFNKVMKMNIWDYSKQPFNVMGQICPLFTVAWGLLGLIFLPLASKINSILDMSSRKT